MTKGTLEDIFRFSAPELAANRDGRMTAGQRLRAVLRALLRLLPAVVLFPLAAVLAYNGYDLWPILGSAAIGLAALYLAYRSFSFSADAVHGQVSVTTGAVDKHLEYEWRSTQYWVQIGDLKSQVSGDRYNALAAGTGLRAYYAPAASALLSVEPEDQPEAVPSRPYGPKTARDLPRGKQVVAFLTLGGVLTGLLGARLFITAQPATFEAVQGPIWNFQSEGGRSTTYYVWLDDNPNGYELRTGPDGFSPHLPDLNTYYGKPAVIYVNGQDGNVAAVNLAERTYTTDLYRDPLIQERDMRASGAAALFFAVLLCLPLLIWIGVAILLRTPSPRDVTPADRKALGRPQVIALMQRIGRLSSDRWDAAALVEPLGYRMGRGGLSAGQWQAVGDAIEGVPDNSRLDTPLGHLAVAAIAFKDKLTDRDFVAMYGPLLKAIPLQELGVEWQMADLEDPSACGPVVEGFRASVANTGDGDRPLKAHLPADKERIAVAICLAALNADPEEKARLANDLVKLAGQQSNGKESEVATLRWLGESEDTARQAVYGAKDPGVELERRHSEQSFITGLGCYVSAGLLIFGGIVAVYMWVTVGGTWGGWVALGLAAAVTPFLGAILYNFAAGRPGGRRAVVLAALLTVGSPAAALLAGWTQIRTPLAVATIAAAAPVTVQILAWVSLREPKQSKLA